MQPEMTVPLLDLRAQYRALKPEIDAAISEVMESQQFILGAKVEACEQAVASYCDCPHGIGVSSGTDALLICLMAEGIGPGDEIITSPYTFFATAGSIARAGAKPVFVDIDPVTFNLDESRIEDVISPRTRAIMPVHLYGQMCDMEAILRIADRHGLVVIEDAAQAIGSVRAGKRAGSLGHYGCFSFFPSKNLGGAGDGGIVVSRDGERADRLRSLRNHGARLRYDHAMIGGNFRLDALQAAIISVKLKHLDAWVSARQENADRYDQAFRRAGLAVSGPESTATNARSPKIRLPEGVTDRHVYNQYVVRIEHRDEIKEELATVGVNTAIYYPVPMHLQSCFAYLGHREGDFPVSEDAARQSLALPIYPELTVEQIEYVVQCLAQSLRTRQGRGALSG